MSSIKNFFYFKDNNKQIVIPQIQRDYAEGRKIGKVNEVRKSLLGDMIYAVCNDKKTELDFVYGYERNGSFEPLDGQQRLTTLFLLSWVLSTNKNNLIVDGQSILSYKNRNTSLDFCNELVKFKSKDIIEKYLDLKRENTKLTLLDFFKKSYWFRYSWNFDSNIQSMLVVINDIYEMLSKQSNYDFNDTSELYEKISNITFKLLDLDSFNMGDELYIKMNARGKELSSFDLLKSYLEQDLSRKNPDSLELLTNWQSKIDCDWMDYLWRKYFTKPVEKNVELVEHKFETLIHIFVWFQILIQANSISNLDEEINIKKITNRSIDEIFDIYKKSNSQFNIDYNILISYFDSLFLKTDDVFTDLDEITNQVFSYNLISEAIENKEYGDLIYLYAEIKWILRFKEEMINLNENVKNNFLDFINFIKNIFKLENAGTQRIDSGKDFTNAMNTINSYVESYFTLYSCNNISFIEYIAGHLEYSNGSQVLAISIEEEKKKASLKLENNEWKEVIKDAESNYYLNGQIYPLLFVEQNDINRFKSVTQKFNEIINDENSLKVNGFKLLKLFMVERPYVSCDNHTFRKTLLQLDNHRDFSLKRHFRDIDLCILTSLKNIMDDWIDKNNQLSFTDYYNQVKINNINEYWRKFIILNGRWYESIGKVFKHLTTQLENDKLFGVNNNNNNVKEEIIIAHIHGTVKLNKNILSLLDDQCRQDRVAFLFNNNEYCIENIGVNEYNLRINSEPTLSRCSYENIISDLNSKIEDIF